MRSDVGIGKIVAEEQVLRLKVARKIRPQVAMPACRVLLISSGCRVKIAAIPPPNAYTAHTNAKTSAKEPNTSMATPLPPGDSGSATCCCAGVNLLPRHRYPPVRPHTWKRI